MFPMSSFLLKFLKSFSSLQLSPESINKPDVSDFTVHILSDYALEASTFHFVCAKYWTRIGSELFVMSRIILVGPPLKGEGYPKMKILSVSSLRIHPHAC